MGFQKRLVKSRTKLRGILDPAQDSKNTKVENLARRCDGKEGNFLAVPIVVGLSVHSQTADVSPRDLIGAQPSSYFLFSQKPSSVTVTRRSPHCASPLPKRGVLCTLSVTCTLPISYTPSVPFCLALAALNIMASDDLDVPQITVVGVPDDNNPSSSSLALPSSSVDSSRLPPSPSTTDNDAYLSLTTTPILKSARNPLEPLGSPTHTSDNSSLPPPSPTLSAHSSGSVRWGNSAILRENSLYPPPSLHGYRPKGRIGSVSSIDSGSTAELDAGDTHHRVRQQPPSPSRETDTGSDTTRYDGQKGDNADAKHKGAGLALPATLDLEQEADLDVHPFAFKPLQLASLVDPKSLETLESMGGVDALLRGLGTHPTHGLQVSTESGSPPAHPASPDPTLQGFTMSHDPPKPEPQGLQSTVSLGGDVPTEFQSSEEVCRTSIEDRQRIFSQNILPRRPSKSLLQLMWLGLKDKVLVSSN